MTKTETKCWCTKILVPFGSLGPWVSAESSPSGILGRRAGLGSELPTRLTCALLHLPDDGTQVGLFIPYCWSERGKGGKVRIRQAVRCNFSALQERSPLEDEWEVTFNFVLAKSWGKKCREAVTGMFSLSSLGIERMHVKASSFFRNQGWVGLFISEECQDISNEIFWKGALFFSSFFFWNLIWAKLERWGNKKANLKRLASLLCLKGHKNALVHSASFTLTLP